MMKIVIIVLRNKRNCMTRDMRKSWCSVFVGGGSLVQHDLIHSRSIWFCLGHWTPKQPIL